MSRWRRRLLAPLRARIGEVEHGEQGMFSTRAQVAQLSRDELGALFRLMADVRGLVRDRLRALGEPDPFPGHVANYETPSERTD